MSTNQQQKKPPDRVERQQEPAQAEADLIATWVPPVPTRWSAGYGYQLEVPVDIQRAIRGVDVYAVAHVVGRGRAEWAVLDDDGRHVRVMLAGLDMREVVVRIHTMPARACPTSGTPAGGNPARG